MNFAPAHTPEITRWRWRERNCLLLTTRTFMFAGIFAVVGVTSSLVFGRLFLIDQMHGGWLILVLIVLSIAMLAASPSISDLSSFRKGKRTGSSQCVAPIYCD